MKRQYVKEVYMITFLSEEMIVKSKRVESFLDSLSKSSNWFSKLLMKMIFESIIPRTHCIYLDLPLKIFNMAKYLADYLWSLANFVLY
jgi:hypothetical protein